jgi:hypothetical protein
MRHNVDKCKLIRRFFASIDKKTGTSFAYLFHYILDKGNKMKTFSHFLVLLMSLSQLSAFAQSHAKVIRTTMDETPFEFASGQYTDGNSEFITYESVGLVADEIDRVNNPYAEVSYDHSKKAIMEAVASAKDEEACAKNLFHSIMQHTKYNDIVMTSYKQSRSLTSTLDRDILNFSGFQILSASAHDSKGNEFKAKFKINFKKHYVTTERKELRSGKVLESHSQDMIQCYLNRGGALGINTFVLRNKAKEVLVEVNSLTMYSPTP